MKRRKIKGERREKNNNKKKEKKNLVADNNVKSTETLPDLGCASWKAES